MYDYLIVGAGLYGSVCAYELRKKGYKVLVVEKRNHIGGNAYTEKIEGVNVHKYGPHIFHTADKEIWDYINQFANFRDCAFSPVARYKSETYNLPFNMNTFVHIWPDVFSPSEAKAKIDAEKAKYAVATPTNLEEQAISLVGKTIYEKLIKGYTEKQWGRACNELPPFIIKRLPVRLTFDNNYFNDRYQGIPLGGYTQIFEKMLDGVEVRLGIDYLEHKDELNALAKNIIYTGAIDAFFDYKFGPLEYRSVRFETEILDETNHQGAAVINYTSSDVPYTRSIEHKLFELDTTSPKTVVSKEYSSSWKVKDEPYYPVNDAKNNSLYEKYKEEASKLNNVHFGGRLGEYKYYDMDKVISQAFDFLRNLLK